MRFKNTILKVWQCLDIVLKIYISKLDNNFNLSNITFLFKRLPNLINNN